MACKLVAARDDAADEIGMAFGDPAQRKESRMGTGRGENIQQPIGAGGNAARDRVPFVARNDARQRLDLEVILDIDAHRVDDASALRGGAAHNALRSSCADMP